jgi:hypothetical protein
MAYMHPALAEHLRKRWERADAYRFAAPGTPEAKPPSTLHPWAEVARQEQAAADEARARAAAEQDEFEREVLRLRHDFAKLKLEYELRRFQQKYSPDQPRVPAGSGRESGRWTDGGGSGAGRDPGFSSDRPGWHDYRRGPTLACGAELRCSREEMADQLARFSLPGRDPSLPIEDEGTYPVHIPGTNIYAGDVETRITDGGLTIENRTKEGHIFFDGIVVRELKQSGDGAWYVTTHGFGNNVQPGSNVVNQLVGPETFAELDRQMRANIERHHAKGILDLAVHRVDGGRRPRSCHLG